LLGSFRAQPRGGVVVMGPGIVPIGRVQIIGRRRWRMAVALLVAGGASLFVAQACTQLPPDDIDDLCAIFAERDTWRRAAERTRERWRVPEPVLLAILHQESRFRAEARPGWRRVLWLFPVGRLSSAFGYGQVKDGTWTDYRRQAGRPDARRNRFADVVDFIGWYASVISRRTGVPPDDPYRLYLAYHEGPSGFARGSHRDKPWLLGVARKVEARAQLYAAQYATCGGPSLPPPASSPQEATTGTGGDGPG